MGANREPIRLTKGRAKALLSVVDLGIAEVFATLEREYGLRKMPDGTLEPTEKYELLDAQELEISDAYVKLLLDAGAAKEIIEHRYA